MTSKDLLYYLGLLLGSFTLTYLLVLKISLVMNAKKILDDPNGRSSHKKAVPNLGGIAFYIVLMLSFFFVDTQDKLQHQRPNSKQVQCTLYANSNFNSSFI